MTIANLRRALRDGSPERTLEAIAAAERLGQRAAALVPDLVALLSSDACLAVEETKHWNERHLHVGREAASALLRIGIAPDVNTVRHLLVDRRSLRFPAASFDHGEYIGDYDTRLVAPAGLAAELVHLMGRDGFLLLPELVANAGHAGREVWEPALLAIERLTGLVAKATDEDVAALERGARAIAALAEAVSPTTTRGLALGNLAALCLRGVAARG